MVEQVEVLHNKLEVTNERGETGASSKVNPSPTLVDKIKFVPNVLLDELKTLDLGFLAINNILPSDFHLDMVTMLANVQVMGSITCVLSSDKDASPSILSFLKYSVTHKNKTVTINTDSSLLKFTFPLPHPGQYHVTAKLYGHHVHGSPLTVPVAVSALPGLAQLGLVPLGADVGGGVEMKSDVVRVTAGLVCVAKWNEDGVWCRAKVDKVEGEVVELTFLDYGNTETVTTANIVKTRSHIPAGEEIDEFVEELEEIEEKVKLNATIGFTTGDFVIAKWNEDEVWYNAKIDDVGAERVGVTFIDYGNEDEVNIDKIVKLRSEIPRGDEADENVIEIDDNSPEIKKVDEGVKKLFQVGDDVVAKWSEDSTWYNAKVEAVNDDEYSVLFTDYGNSATAKHAEVLKSAVDIPSAEIVDECVKVATAEDIPADETVVECVEVMATAEDIPVAETVEVTHPSPAVTVGSECIACWSEDSVWYNARVDGVEEGGQYHVTFTDYGNTDLVTRDRIVDKTEDIPADQADMIDECVLMNTNGADSHSTSPPEVLNTPDSKEDSVVTTSKSSWSEGDPCVACWSEDGVWYNARVESEVRSGQYQVTFTDYGNQDNISMDRIVATARDIPADQIDMVHECVKIENVEASQIPSSSGPASAPYAASPSQSWSVGNAGIARWSEDNVWYNAVVDRVDQASGDIHVTFTDYGNTAIVTSDNIVTTAEDIPADQLDMIDECVVMSNTPSSQVSSSNTIDEAPIQVVKKEETEKKVSKNSSANTKSPICSPHKVGDAVVARWSEDDVWCNAVVDSLDEVTGEAHVTFIDYGNTATVSLNKIVATANDIPTDEHEMVDECVVMPNTSSSQVTSSNTSDEAPIQVVKKEESEEKVSTNCSVHAKSPISSPHKVGDSVVARWSEDDV